MRIHNINDQKLHGSIENLSENVKKIKGKTGCGCIDFGISTMSRLEASELCVSSRSRSVLCPK